MIRRLALVAAALLLVASARPQDAPPEPQESGLTETTRARLAQIDVTVYGPADVVGTLTADDFELRIQATNIKEFTVDRLCGPPSGTGPASDSPLHPSYLLYFDQPHLTLAGRQNAIDIARRLVAELVVAGARAMIVSNARAVQIVQPLTADPALLTSALERLEWDRLQWDEYAELEDRRVADVMRELNTLNNYERAVALARRYQQEERVRTERDLRRLAATLSQLAEATPPRSVVYFADTTRGNAGEHYLAFFGRDQRFEEPVLGTMMSDSNTAQLSMDRVLNEAAAQGIRIHTIEARGLQLGTDLGVQAPIGMSTGGAVASSSRVRVGDAHRTLEGLAAESGGQAFLHGMAPAKIAERLAADTTCLYLVSFDPSGFREDQPLRVSVRMRRPGVTQRTRGRLVVASASARLTTEILRAFSAPNSIPDPFEVRSGLIPTGFKDGRYSALLQISVPGSALEGAKWDLGATLVAGEKVRGRTAARLGSSAPWVPVILESEIEFPAGAYDLVAVAHEERTGLVSSQSQRVSWPKLRPSAAGIGPIAVAQPTVGAFLRGGATRHTGSISVGADEPVDATRPTAMVTVVCPGGAHAASRVVERALHGPTEHEFPPQDMSGETACAQLRDVVPSNTMHEGPYRYVLRVVEGARTLVESEREIIVVGPAHEGAAAGVRDTP